MMTTSAIGESLTNSARTESAPSGAPDAADCEGCSIAPCSPPNGRGPFLRSCADARRDDRLDAAADVEITDDLHPTWGARFREIVQDAVHCALVEDAIVPEAPE